MVDQRARVAFSLTFWYLTSFGTLLLNKYLLGSRGVKPNSLAVVQMVSTAIYGAMKELGLSGLFKVMQGNAFGQQDKVEDLEDGRLGPGSMRVLLKRRAMQMGLVGAMRFATVVLGLVSLKYIAASFTETIKASAPFFTVIIAYLMIGEKTPCLAILALIPVAFGLVLTSATEISFNTIGFSAAVATNVLECVQNVFSKRLLSGEFTASQLQFYTSLTALVLQIPMVLIQEIYFGYGADAADEPTIDSGVFDNSTDPDGGRFGQGGGSHTWFLSIVFLLWIDGVLYHLQSVAAYMTMSLLSPVTVSVANTIKRALVIWLSVMAFGNEVIFSAKLGTLVCLLGALAYNYAKQMPRTT